MPEYTELLEMMLGNAIIFLQKCAEIHEGGKPDMQMAWVISASKALLGREPEWKYDGS